MIIKSIEIPEKTYDCYDFTFLKGGFLPVTLNLEAGDTIEVGDSRIVINVLEKPSLSDPGKLIPSEDFVIERRNLLFYIHRAIKIEEQTAEQREEWRNTLLQATQSTNKQDQPY